MPRTDTFIATIAVAASTAIGSAMACASPVEFDTASAHVIVARPIDSWSGDSSAQKHSLESLRERKVSYDVILDGTRYRGSPLILQGISDNPITRGVEATLAEERITLVRNAPYLFHVLDVATFAAGAYPTFARAQAEYYRRFVERSGDPRTLATRYNIKEMIGNALTIGALFLPTGSLGVANGAQVMMNSGLAEDIGKLPRGSRAALVPVRLPDLDPAAYRQIDVRRVEFKPDTPGEIVIAYKGEKTPEAEAEALVRAIAIVAGAQTTADAVESARRADFQERVSIWDACVNEGKCQNGGQQ
ncbi:hypothetical protein LGM85_28170 [Burkholderia multivorans]|uniref:hypothetical protein n=1 Tax=Burkholderia multivorans TaxID=87883 RepID=UPI0019D20319|nr:hypothetical protein [Burkholderia multivorans]MBN6738842.1 hypothetical protein [Burkholderia multivorans]MBN7130547.1 hypothetical protein [Burkholderia multivorans]MBN8173439.1 hypothetical protein [Burkholderia multivorans]MBU9370983.1 hypothetical protein [Burkholderia multivorans]MBU9439434.1 hypothetical protein [Burkholderia multivorans]